MGQYIPQWMKDRPTMVEVREALEGTKAMYQVVHEMHESVIRKPLMRENYARQLMVTSANSHKSLAVRLGDMLMTVQVGINSVAEQEMRHLISVVRGTRYGIHGINHELTMIENLLDGYDRHLIEHMDEEEKKGNFGALRKDHLAMRIADQLDASDDVIHPIIVELKEHYKRHIPMCGKIAPADPWIVKQMCLCNHLVASSVNVWDFIHRIHPLCAESMLFGKMSFQPVLNRLDKIWGEMPIYNNEGKRIKLHLDGVLAHPDVIGTKNEKTGQREGGILLRLKDALFSTKFIDMMYVIRDGIDPRFRDERDSILDNGVKYDGKIVVPDAPTSEEAARMEMQESAALPPKA